MDKFKFGFIYTIIVFSSNCTADLPYLSNFGLRCLQCICEGVEGGCDRTLGCDGGYCGAFRISRLYWIDAGNITFQFDSFQRNNIYQDCSLDYECSLRIVWSYFERHAQDCNGDGVTNCDDYAMLHFNERRNCHRPMNRDDRARKFWRNYANCDPLDRKLILPN